MKRRICIVTSSRADYGSLSSLMSEIKEDGDVASELEGVFSLADDYVITRLSSDFETISIHGTGEAAVNCVVALQELYRFYSRR